MAGPSSEAADRGGTVEKYRDRLHRILARDGGAVNTKIQQVLQIGAERFEVALGSLVQVDESGDSCRIVEVSTSRPDLTRGLAGDLLSSYCRAVMIEQEPLVVDNVSSSAAADNAAYGSTLLSTYIGSPVDWENGPYGTVCFVDLEPRRRAFEERDRSFLAFLAQTIEQLLDREAHGGGQSSARRSRDVTGDRARARRALKRSPVIFAKVDANLRYEWMFNPHPDFDPDSIIGKRDDELDSGPEIDRLMDLKRRTLERGEQIREEIVFAHADGLTVYDFAATPLREGDGNGVTGLLTAALNVTDRKDTERQLRESGERFQTLAEHFPHGAVGVYTPDLRYTLVRGPLVGGVLPSSEEFEGRRVSDVFPEETASDIIPLFRAAVEDERTGSAETKFGGRDWKVWATPVRNERGEVYAGLSFAQDITEQKNREDALRQQRNLLQQAQRLSGAWEVDVRTGAVTWSKTVYEIHELPADTDLDIDAALSFYPSDARADLEEAFQRCLDEEKSYDLELRLITAKGNERWVRTVGAPVEIDAGRVVKVAGGFQDITDRKREEAKRDEVIRRVTDAIVEVDADWRFTLVNDQAEELYDVQETELLGREFWSVFSEALGTRFEETYRRVMRTREPASLVEYYSDLDSWFAVQVYPNDDGGLAVYFQDVTEQMQRQARLRDLSNSIPGVVFQFFARDDGTYGFYFVSEHAEEVLGVSPDSEDFFERCLQRIPDSHRDAFLASIERAVADQDTWEFEAPFDKPSGERRWILGRSMPRPQNGELVFNGVLLDITERREAERALWKSERRFRKVFENAATGIVIADEEGRLLQANPAFQSMIGYEESELVGRHFSEITHPDDVDPNLDLFSQLVAGKRDQYQREKRYVGKNGEVFWTRLTVSLLEVDEEKKYVALVEDIDDQKHFEEKLRTAKTEAEEAARLKSVMLGNMSHEVRTPLTSMIGFSGILEAQLEGKSAKLARLIRKSGLRLEDTMEAALQLSQLESGSYTLDRESLRLDSIVRRVAKEFELQATESGVALDVETDEEPVDLYADETAVRRVVASLLENALKFTPEDGQVTLRTYRGASDTAVLEVEDTGIGIAQDAVPDVFEAFKQESEGLTRKFEGAGLGLAIVKNLVEALDGRIEVETEKGEGTLMRVFFPGARGRQSSGSESPGDGEASGR